MGGFRTVPLASLVLVVASVLATLVVLEGLLRLVYPPPLRFVYPQEQYDPDPEIGYVLRPNQHAFNHHHALTTNALGMRHAEVSPHPFPGRRRALAIGDSQTFGNGLALEETWPMQLETMLGPSWEIINAGIPATDTWQHEILLRRLLPRVRPDVVILAVYVNDIAPRVEDPSRLLQVASTNTWRKRLVYAAKRSALVTLALSRLAAWGTVRNGGGTSAEDAIVSGARHPAAERGWNQVRQSLTVMHDICLASRVGFVLVALPRRDQVSGAHLGRAYNQRLRSLAEELRIELVDVLPALADAYHQDGDALFIPWDGHNAAAANRVIAAEMARRLGGQRQARSGADR